MLTYKQSLFTDLVIIIYYLSVYMHVVNYIAHLQMKEVNKGC